MQKPSIIPHLIITSYGKIRQIIVALFICTFVLLGSAIPSHATGVYDLPIVTPGSSIYILDQADIISRSNEGQINNQLQELAQTTGQEVRLVVIRRLDFDETINSFTDKLFSQWYSDSEAKNHQTLLVLDTLTNAAAIHTGEDVKSLLSDQIADSVVNETVAIPLREGGKYNQALLDATNRLSLVLSGKPDPGPPSAQEINTDSTFTSAEETNDFNATIWVIVLLSLATIIPMVTYFWYVGFGK